MEGSNNNFLKEEGVFFLEDSPTKQEFTNELKKVIEENRELKYRGCRFSFPVDISNYEFNKKVRFHNCTFEKGIKCRNTTFNELIDFYQSTFESNQIFHLTDFLSISIFSETTFKKAVIFRHNKVSANTYISFEKAIFKNGLDISNSNFWCTLQVYGIKVELAIPDMSSFIFYLKYNMNNEEFESENRDFILNNLSVNPFGNKKDGVDYVIKNIENKKEIEKEFNKMRLHFLYKNTYKGLRESYRRIKQEFRKNENHIESLDFHHHEMTAFKNELNFKSGKKTYKNKVIIYMNKYSNDYKRNWFMGVVFTMIFAFVFFNIIFFQKLKGVSYTYEFINFLNPLNLNSESYRGLTDIKIVLLYISKIFIGFGYYQTIQAFRKYGKN
jgi:hypothetical protein